MRCDVEMDTDVEGSLICRLHNPGLHDVSLSGELNPSKTEGQVTSGVIGGIIAAMRLNGLSP